MLPAPQDKYEIDEEEQEPNSPSIYEKVKEAWCDQCLHSISGSRFRMLLVAICMIMDLYITLWLSKHESIAAFWIIAFSCICLNGVVGGYTLANAVFVRTPEDWKCPFLDRTFHKDFLKLRPFRTMGISQMIRSTICPIVVWTLIHEVGINYFLLANISKGFLSVQKVLFFASYFWQCPCAYI